MQMVISRTTNLTTDGAILVGALALHGEGNTIGSLGLNLEVG